MTETDVVYQAWFKRPFDAVAAFAALQVLAPVLLAVACAIAMIQGRPVFFLQTRPGLRGRPFTLIKFRTMTDERDGPGGSDADQARITRWGRILRRTSLDELPQLFNVLKGDMSLVGPRPLLMEYLDLYSTEQARRHEVRPGITGWAQVSGRNALSWEEKFKLDVWYVAHVSFLLDARILLRTMVEVLLREGVSAEGHATVPRFSGTKDVLDGDGPTRA